MVHKLVNIYTKLVAALKITYIVLHLYCLYDKFRRDYSLIMRNVNVHLVNFFCTICLHTHVNGSIWHNHSSEFYLST